MVVSGEGNDGESELPLETISVFIRNNQLSSITVTSLSKNKCPIKSYQSFGTSCNGRFFVGVEQDVYEYNSSKNESPIWSKLPSTKVDRSGPKCY